MNSHALADDSASGTLPYAGDLSFAPTRLKVILRWTALIAALGVIAGPAVAACEREVDLAALVIHAGRGHAGSATDKFALVREQCGDVTQVTTSAAAAGAREARQLSLYSTPAHTTPSTGAGDSTPRSHGPSSMASVLGGGQRRQTELGLIPPHRPSKVALRVQALADTVTRAAARYRLDPLLLHAIASVESNHDTSARSSAGALGVMQVMPHTARRFGVQHPERTLHDPTVNIDVSAAYLSALQEKFENNLRLMLAAYNAGEGAVQRYGNRVPPYAETQNYVRRVLDTYTHLQRRAGGVAL